MTFDLFEPPKQFIYHFWLAHNFLFGSENDYLTLVDFTNAKLILQI